MAEDRNQVSAGTLSEQVEDMWTRAKDQLETYLPLATGKKPEGVECEKPRVHDMSLVLANLLSM